MPQWTNLRLGCLFRSVVVLLVLTCNVNTDRPAYFKLGLLAPWNSSFDDFSALTSASAVSMAIEAIHDDPSLSDKMRFSVVTRDSACLSKQAAGNAVRLFIEDGVDAFIGPPCSSACRPAAEMASYWNKPIVSWVATDPELGDKSIYTTLSRTIGPFDKMGIFLLEVFKQYGWRRVVVISSNYFIWLDAGKAIRKVFRENNITISFSSDFDRDPPDHYIKSVLIRTRVEGRIVILIVPKEDRRRFMLQAHDLSMTNGDYVFYTIELLPDELVLNPEDIWASNDERDDDARTAFESVFHVSLAALSNERIGNFRKEVAERMRRPPWNQYVSKYRDMTNFENGDKYAAFLYDAVLLYAMALNETFNKGMDTRSGFDVSANMKGKVFSGITGKIVLDSKGDREPDLWITDMVPNGTFIRIAETLNTDAGGKEFRKDISPPRWPGGKIGHSFAPPDAPLCGFRNEFCRSEEVASWVIVVAVVLSLLAVGAASGLAVYCVRLQRYETSLLSEAWRIVWEDVETLKGNMEASAATQQQTKSSSDVGSQISCSSGHRSIASQNLEIIRSKIMASSTGNPSTTSRSMYSVATGAGQVFSDVGVYKGIVVTLKKLQKQHISLTRTVLLEFNDMKELVHENVNVFVGACIDHPNICLLWHYASKGSLNDLLMNDEVKLDNVFKFSFMADIVKGMGYLHKTAIQSHGNLKSSNCVVDSRWAAKITDYGMPSILAGQSQEENQNESYKRKLWTAPEILRDSASWLRGTQKGDVFSFAIIAYEIAQRSEPYLFDVNTPRDVVNRVRNGESIPYRPTLSDSADIGRPIVHLIRTCWAEDAEKRPLFQKISILLRKITGKINIADNVIRMMEKYASNLEELVDERTQQMVDEKMKTDRLLYRMLPSSVAEQLKLGKFVQPENFEEGTIYFSDIIGFTTLTMESSAIQIVDFLNDLYSRFDDVIAKHDVYKVETIGDAYMVASGVPTRNGNRHAAEVANVSLDLLSEAMHFRIRHRPHQQLLLRIGLHSGPIVAGVVGLIMPRYCLFGDTVNMAARMESKGKALHIHVSKITYIILNELALGYEMTLRGEVNIKGKGLQTTYWLHGKKGFSKPLPPVEKGELGKSDGAQLPMGHHGLMRTFDQLHNDEGMPTESISMPQVV